MKKSKPYGSRKRFNSKADALRALKSKRRRIVKRIARRGDTILCDRSTVLCVNAWEPLTNSLGGINGSRMTEKWSGEFGCTSSRKVSVTDSKKYFQNNRLHSSIAGP